MENNFKVQKKNLRKRVNQYLQNLSEKQKTQYSLALFKLLENQQIFRESKTILLYWSLNNEVYTHDFIKKWNGHKKILLPVVVGNDLMIKEFDGEKTLIKNHQYPILEPQGLPFKDFSKLDLIIVPGMAFDKSNNRLGRGKGFYDRFLKNTSAYKIGICFPFQLFEQIPVSEHDVKMDAVISLPQSF